MCPRSAEQNRELGQLRQRTRNKALSYHHQEQQEVIGFPITRNSGVLSAQNRLTGDKNIRTPRPTTPPPPLPVAITSPSKENASSTLRLAIPTRSSMIRARSALAEQRIRKLDLALNTNVPLCRQYDTCTAKIGVLVFSLFGNSFAVTKSSRE